MSKKYITPSARLFIDSLLDFADMYAKENDYESMINEYIQLIEWDYEIGMDYLYYFYKKNKTMEELYLLLRKQKDKNEIITNKMTELLKIKEVQDLENILTELPYILLNLEHNIGHIKGIHNMIINYIY